VIDADTGISSPWTGTFWPVDRPLWSLDDSRIAFGSLRGREFDLYLGRLQQSGDDAELLWRSAFNKRASDWSRDEQLFLYEQRDSSVSGHWDLWTLSIPDKHATQVTQTPSFDEVQAQFSPDARFIAYASNESGNYQVWIRDLTGAFKRPVSINGGVQPRWNKDGKELFYIAADQSLMSVKIQDRSTATHAELQFGKPTPLFKAPLFQDAANFLPAQYAVSDNGQRFLLNVPIDGPAAPITVILNWTATLRSK
jgi:Tol biopolymer transport system component